MQGRNARRPTPVEQVRDFILEGGCIVCGGPIDVRLSPGHVRGVCAPCGWISRPMLVQAHGQVSLAHLPLAVA